MNKSQNKTAPETKMREDLELNILKSQTNKKGEKVKTQKQAEVIVQSLISGRIAQVTEKDFEKGINPFDKKGNPKKKYKPKMTKHEIEEIELYNRYVEIECIETGERAIVKFGHLQEGYNPFE